MAKQKFISRVLREVSSSTWVFLK